MKKFTKLLVCLVTEFSPNAALAEKSLKHITGVQNFIHVFCVSFSNPARAKSHDAPFAFIALCAGHLLTAASYIAPIDVRCDVIVLVKVDAHGIVAID